MYFYSNGYYLPVTPENYVISFGSTSDECVIGFISSSDYSGLFGDVFLRNYYSIWDNDNAKLGLAAHTYATKQIVAGTTPATSYTPDSSENNYYDINYLKTTFLLTGTSVVFSGFGFLTYWIYFKPIV